MSPNADPALVAARIAAGDDRSRYDRVAMTLHWLTAALVILQFALAELWEFAPRPLRRYMIMAHMSFGILLAAVVIARIIWRLMPGHQIASAVSGLVEIASKAVHYLLYILLLTQAALGFALRWGGNESMNFFGLMIPPFFPPFDKPLEHTVGEAHEIVGWVIIGLAGVHAAAALFHHYFLRDTVLLRMMPKKT